MTIKWDEITFDNVSNLENVLKIFDQAFPIEVRESLATCRMTQIYKAAIYILNTILKLADCKFTVSM